MKKIFSMVTIIMLLVLFVVPFKSYAAVVDMSGYTSETLETTFTKESITGYDLTKYNQKNDKRVNIYVFRGDGCVNCKNFYQYYVANKLLTSHGDKIRIISYEVRNNTKNFNLLDKAKTLVNEQAGSYATPTVFIGNKTFSGDLVVNNATQKQAEMEAAINALYNSSERYDIIEKLAGKNVFKEATSNITLTSAQKLDSDYTLKVTKIDRKNVTLEEKYTYIDAYDIAMYNGNIVVPLSNGSYTIHIPVSTQYDTYKVGYVKDGVVQEEFDATAQNGGIEFTTTHLSEYVIYGYKEPTPPTPTQPSTPDTTPSTPSDNKPDSTPDTTPDVVPDETPETETNPAPIVSDTKPAKKEETKSANPKTFDGIEATVILLGMSCATLFGSFVAYKKKRI